MGEGGFFGLFLAVGAAWVALLVGPIGQAIARRVGGKKARESHDGPTTGEVAAERLAEVEHRLALVESVQQRLLELEERVDFAERLLTRAETRPPGEIGPPTDARVVTPV